MSRLDGDEIVKDIASTYSKIETDIKDSCEKIGVKICEQPKFSKEVELYDNGEPKMPDDITRHSLDSIGTYFSMCHSWLSYLLPQLALAEVRADAWDEIRKVAWAKIRSDIEGTTSDKDDRTRTNTAYVRYNSEYLKHQAQYKILKGKVEQYVSLTKLLSRELSRRGFEAYMNSQMQGAENRAKSIANPNYYQNIREKPNLSERKASLMPSFKEGKDE